VGERSSRETSGSKRFIRVSSARLRVWLVLKVERGERGGESEILLDFLFEVEESPSPFAFDSQERRDTGDTHWLS